MKDYLNSNDTLKFTILAAMDETVEKAINRPILSESEKTELTKVREHLKNFYDSFFNRMGDAVARKIVNNLKINTLCFCGKYGQMRDALSNFNKEDLIGVVDDLMLERCFDCKKTNFKDCVMYKCGVTCEMKVCNEEGGCPFKKYVEDMEFI